MSVIKKTKTVSKSKSNSKSRKHFNKSRKYGSNTRKIRGGAPPLPEYIAPQQLPEYVAPQEQLPAYMDNATVPIQTAQMSQNRYPYHTYYQLGDFPTPIPEKTKHDEKFISALVYQELLKAKNRAVNNRNTPQTKLTELRAAVKQFAQKHEDTFGVPMHTTFTELKKYQELKF
jgi:hypothetical protein